MLRRNCEFTHLNQLYDHYFEILNANEFPELASTGYQTARENHPHNDIILLIEAAIKDLSGKVKSNAIKQLCKTNPNVRSALEVQKRLCWSV